MVSLPSLVSGCEESEDTRQSDTVSSTLLMRSGELSDILEEV